MTKQQQYFYALPSYGADSDIRGCFAPVTPDLLDTLKEWNLRAGLSARNPIFASLQVKASGIKWPHFEDEALDNHTLEKNDGGRLIQLNLDELGESEWTIEYSRFQLDGTDTVRILGFYKGVIGYEWAEFSLTQYEQFLASTENATITKGE